MTQFLPPNLLALFAPRDPIPYLPPLDKLPHEKKSHAYTGVSQFLQVFEDPKDTPPPTRVETKDERKERKRKERAEQVAYKLEQDLALWDPTTQHPGDPYKSIFVARVNYDTSESKLRREFEVYGPVKRISVCSDTNTGKMRGYAFVEYEHERDMHSAYKHADGKKIDGRRVLVDIERGRTIKGWRPRRLGGGLGGTRRGGPDVNTKYSGRDDNPGAFGGRDDRSRSRERLPPRRRSRSPRERRPRRSRSPREVRERRSRRSRSRERKARGGEEGAPEEEIVAEDGSREGGRYDNMREDRAKNPRAVDENGRDDNARNPRALDDTRDDKERKPRLLDETRDDKERKPRSLDENARDDNGRKPRSLDEERPRRRRSRSPRDRSRRSRSRDNKRRRRSRSRDRKRRSRSRERRGGDRPAGEFGDEEGEYGPVQIKDEPESEYPGEENNGGGQDGYYGNSEPGEYRHEPPQNEEEDVEYKQEETEDGFSEYGPPPPQPVEN